MSYKYFLSKRLLNVYTKHVLFNISNKNNVFSLKNQFCFINLSTTLKNQKPIYILNSVFASFKEYVILAINTLGNARRRQRAASKVEKKTLRNHAAGSNLNKENEQQQEKNDFNNFQNMNFPKGMILVAIVGGTLLALTFFSNTPMAPQITWSEFINKILPTGQVSKIVVWPSQDMAYVFTHGSFNKDAIWLGPVYQLGVGNPQKFESDVRAIEAELNVPPERWIQIEFKGMGNASIITQLIIFGLLISPLIYMARKMKSFKITDIMSRFTQTKINIIDPHSKSGRMNIKFKDVAGLHEAKIEINEFVDYLKSPSQYTRLGAKLPRGAIMTGPPGCGKTLLAKALAAEASVPFISMNGSEFIEMIGGLGASRIRNLFKEAKSRAPCIIYIDEIDAIGRKRTESSFGQGSGEEEQTLNQLLVEMDGMGTNQGVVVIGSTNRPDILDKALIRPGRFDRHVTVDLPTLIERKELFELYLKKIKRENQIINYVHHLAQMTPGFSGADIANVVNESAIHAATNFNKIVKLSDIDYALQKIIAGPEKRSKVMVEEERQIVAYHESGHALVGWLLEHTDALLKVTIIPRTSAALGFAQYSPRDRKLFNKEELFDRMCMMLGGRAAENVIFGRITTGAQNDLEKVTKQAHAQVKIYGMSERFGVLSFAPQPGDERSFQFQKKPYSQYLQTLMDEEVSKLVSQAYFVTEKLLRDNQNKLETLTKELLKREILNYEDVKRLIGPPPFGEKHVIDIAEQILPENNNK